MAVQGETREKSRVNIREPKHYRVIMHNDDFTSMDFVVSILVDIFHKAEMEAEQLMLLVHETGKTAIGSYPYDIAITKVQAATNRAKEEGFPFRMTIEEA
ncbi:MAG: ATP-dependent Clp protease adaptor ClpS [Lachnospiraceae bacterium]|nr:ATP-dependent Clp protease adaptor ClpS [Lachnospiraceae bacterium]